MNETWEPRFLPDTKFVTVAGFGENGRIEAYRITHWMPLPPQWEKGV